MNEAKNYIIIALLVVATAFGWFLWGNISDNRTRDAEIKQQLTTLERNQQLLTTQLDGLSKDLVKSQRRIESISSRIANAESGVSEVAGKLADSEIALTESARLIAENESIISAIQQRAKTNSK